MSGMLGCSHCNSTAGPGSCPVHGAQAKEMLLPKLTAVNPEFTILISPAQAERNQLEKERNQYKAMLERVTAAWSDSWDCSASPGHEEMHKAIGEAVRLLSGL